MEDQDVPDGFHPLHRLFYALNVDSCPLTTETPTHSRFFDDL
jgi:hypothetical protein